MGPFSLIIYTRARHTCRVNKKKKNGKFHKYPPVFVNTTLFVLTFVEKLTLLYHDVNSRISVGCENSLCG